MHNEVKARKTRIFPSENGKTTLTYLSHEVSINMRIIKEYTMKP